MPEVVATPTDQRLLDFVEVVSALGRHAAAMPDDGLPDPGCIYCAATIALAGVVDAGRRLHKASTR